MHFDKLKSILSNPINPEIQSTMDYKLAAVLVVIYGETPTIIMTE